MCRFAHHCGYCNFTVVAGRDGLAERYLAAIECELASLGEPWEVDTLFLGGGTPTHLPDDQLRRLLDAVLRWFPPAAGYEFSMEANPIDVDRRLVETLAEYGVNRISLGAQSFAADKLRLLERDHTGDDIARAVELAREGIRSISLDLIFGVPDETLAGWIADLSAAIELAPDHVSTYGLTFERGTSFWNRLAKNELARIDEELERSMYLAAIDVLSAADFEHYEVSNFARPNNRCRHNEAYWAGSPYFAVGPGAARYVDGRREMNHRSTTTYLNRVLAGESPVAESETLLPEDRAREALVFGLRRLEGVDRREFLERTGFNIDALVQKPLARCVELGLLADEGERIRLTREGLLVSDAIWPEFLKFLTPLSPPRERGRG